jgi:deglycase
MAGKLDGKRVAFLATDGVEQIELTEPWKAVQQEGGKPELLSPKEDRVQGFDHVDEADTFEVDRPVSEATASDYAGLVLPGGVVNADHLRMDEDAVGFVRGFFEEGLPVAVICHGAWILIEAGAARGRKLTSYPSLQTDLRNAGAEWVDEEVVVDAGLVSSRRPDDLPAFCDKLVEEICEGRHERQALQAAGAGSR